MKQIFATGRLGKDAELRRTQDGKPVLGFSIATDHGYGQNKITYWFECSIWGKRGEALEQHLVKGKEVSLIGDFSTREHNGKTYLQIDVQQIDMHGGGQKPERSPAQEQSAYERDDPRTHGRDDDSEIPF